MCCQTTLLIVSGLLPEKLELGALINWGGRIGTLERLVRTVAER